MYRNAEGYADPTAGAALANIRRAEKRYRKHAIGRKEKLTPPKQDKAEKKGARS